MDGKEELEALQKRRASTYEKMLERDTAIKRAKDSGKPHGMLGIWAKRSEEDRDAIKRLDEQIRKIEDEL